MKLAFKSLGTLLEDGPEQVGDLVLELPRAPQVPLVEGLHHVLVELRGEVVGGADGRVHAHAVVAQERLKKGQHY